MSCIINIDLIKNYNTKNRKKRDYKINVEKQISIFIQN